MSSSSSSTSSSSSSKSRKQQQFNIPVGTFVAHDAFEGLLFGANFGLMCGLIAKYNYFHNSNTGVGDSDKRNFKSLFSRDLFKKSKDSVLKNRNNMMKPPLLRGFIFYGAFCGTR